MHSFRQEEVRADEGNAGQRGLQIENHPPRLKRDDDASYERPKRWSDECAREEPSHSGSAFGGAVYVPNTRSADGEEGSTFEGGEDAEDEVGREVG